MGLCLMITTDISRAAGPARHERPPSVEFTLTRIPLRHRGPCGQIRAGRSVYRRNGRTERPKKQHLVHRPGGPFGLLPEAQGKARSRERYIRSIMALPKPE